MGGWRLGLESEGGALADFVTIGRGGWVGFLLLFSLCSLDAMPEVGLRGEIGFYGEAETVFAAA